MSTWQLQQAKQRFSEVIRAAELGEPQMITRHGQGVAVILDFTSYQQLAGQQTGLKQLLEEAPFPEGFEFGERSADPERETGVLGEPRTPA
jgi:prevent-host-death family protein